MTDGLGCSVIAHLHCYFTAGSRDANDTITDIEHWQCKNCGGLSSHYPTSLMCARGFGLLRNGVVPCFSVYLFANVPHR